MDGMTKDEATALELANLLVSNGGINKLWEGRMVQAQARHITNLREQVKERENQIDALRRERQRERQAARYYMMLQSAIAESPTLQSEWRRFIAIAKLSFEEPVKGLTKTDLHEPISEHYL